MIEFRNSFTEEIEAVNADEVYGILAAPTCTMFSLARTTAKTPRDFESGMKLVEKCLEIIWYCRASNDSALKFWALENPQGYLRQFLGRPPFTFSPEEYGENYTKKTDIWGYFNIPKKNPYRLSPDEQLLSCRNNRVLPELPDDYIMPEGWNRQAARRSMTSKRFAEAFYNPTAYAGTKNIIREESETERRASELIKILKFIIRLAGFELIERVKIKDTKTGREFR